jgi:hypothetical protein
VFSCAVIGLDGVVVEVDTTNGLPGMDILGSKDLNFLPGIIRCAVRKGQGESGGMDKVVISVNVTQSEQVVI